MYYCTFSLVESISSNVGLLWVSKPFHFYLDITLLNVNNRFQIFDTGIVTVKEYNGAFFLLRQSGLSDLARCVCRSFIRPSVSFLVF